MNRLITISTNNEVIYNKLNSLKYNNEVRIPIRSDRDKMAVQRIIENINRKQLNIQSEHINYYTLRKTNPVNFNVYKKTNFKRLV
jgi:hypothetical protein